MWTQFIGLISRSNGYWCTTERVKFLNRGMITVFQEGPYYLDLASLLSFTPTLCCPISKCGYRILSLICQHFVKLKQYFAAMSENFSSCTCNRN
jgi:hypothetical protein